MSTFPTTLNGQAVTVEFTYTEGFAGSWDEPPYDSEVEISAVWWKTTTDITLPIQSKALPPVVLKKFEVEIDIMPTLDDDDLELLEEDIYTCAQQNKHDY